MKDYTAKPFLTAKDEEYQMLIEVAEEYTRQRSYKTAERKSGDASEIVVRNHLLQSGLNISKPKVKINGSSMEIDLLSLKNKVNPNRDTPYEPSEVDTVIEVKNNAVGGKRRSDGTQEDPNERIRNDFNRLERLTKTNRFAVVVLSETLLPPRKPYKWRFCEEKIGKTNCRVFTLVARKRWDKMYQVGVVKSLLGNQEMKKTGEWEDFVAYLKHE
jgi:hypothetical protein